jgi:hypothetical protein
MDAHLATLFRAALAHRIAGAKCHACRSDALGGGGLGPNLTKTIKARQIAANIAKLPVLLTARRDL